jgi:outer membrane receptor protein involved in Fe transport
MGEGTVYYDAQVTYRYGPASFTLGGRNLFGRRPPIELTASSNSYDSFLDDMPGRYLYARASVRF